MPLHEDLLRIATQALQSCQGEWEIELFASAVREGRGWQWIWQRSDLGAKITLPQAPLARVVIDQYTAFQLREVLNTFDIYTMRFGEASMVASQNPGYLMTRLRFCQDLMERLGNGILDAQFTPQVPERAAEQTFSGGHEGGIGLVELLDGPVPAFELVGNISAGWAGRTDACRAMLRELAQWPMAKPSACIGQISRDAATRIFGSLPEDSGGSCLLGLMVADLTTATGQKLRLVSATANSCSTGNTYAAHTKRGQKGNQIHMEIFQFERLNQVIEHVGRNQRARFTAVDVGILGYKTSGVVSENDMCHACQGALETNLTDRIGKSVGQVDAVVVFLSA